MADRDTLRNLHPFPGKILNILPLYRMPYPPIKLTSKKYPIMPEGLLLCLWGSPLSHCFTNKYTFTLNSADSYFNPFLHEAKNPQWLADLWIPRCSECLHQEELGPVTAVGGDSASAGAWGQAVPL